MKYNALGQELPDPDPIEIPAGFMRPPTLQEQIERCFRGIVSRAAQNSGHETLEEANDFEVDDDDPTERDTRYTQMGDDIPADVRARAAGQPVAGSAGSDPAVGQPSAAGGAAPASAGPAVPSGSAGVSGDRGGQPSAQPVGGSQTPR